MDIAMYVKCINVNNKDMKVIITEICLSLNLSVISDQNNNF